MRRAAAIGFRVQLVSASAALMVRSVQCVWWRVAVVWLAVQWVWCSAMSPALAVVQWLSAVSWVSVVAVLRLVGAVRRLMVRELQRPVLLGYRVVIRWHWVMFAFLLGAMRVSRGLTLTLQGIRCVVLAHWATVAVGAMFALAQVMTAVIRRFLVGGVGAPVSLSTPPKESGIAAGFKLRRVLRGNAIARESIDFIAFASAPTVLVVPR